MATLTRASSKPATIFQNRETQNAGRISRWQAVGNWLRLAAHPATVRRALMTVAIVGSVLIAINHGDAILRGEINRVRVAKMLLTLAVPYIVSTVSSVSTRRELGQKAVSSKQ